MLSDAASAKFAGQFVGVVVFFFVSFSSFTL